jgi:hypothetical protein
MRGGVKLFRLVSPRFFLASVGGGLRGGQHGTAWVMAVARAVPHPPEGGNGAAAFTGMRLKFVAKNIPPPAIHAP